MLEQAQKIIPEVPSTIQMRPNVLSVEGEDHKRLRRLVNSSFTSGNTNRHRNFMRDHATNLLNDIKEKGEEKHICLVYFILLSSFAYY